MPSARPTALCALRHVRALLFVAVAAVAGVAVDGGAVSAHTEFSGSSPSAGDVVAEPVDTVTLRFTGPAEEAGDGFVALDASGEVRQPTSVSTPDNEVFTLSFDPPLAGGEIGLRWSVLSADGHPIDGAFSFTVTAPVPTVPTTSTIAPTTSTAATTTTVAEPAPTAPVTTSATTVPAVVASAEDDESPDSAQETASLDEFLEVDTSRPGELQATLGRLVSFPAVAFTIGGIAFLWTALRGGRGEIRSLVIAVRVAGAIVAVGAAIEYGGVARLAGESITASWTSSPGLAPALRIVAGLAVAFGLAASAAPAARATARSLSSAVDSALDTGAGHGSSRTADSATTRDSSDGDLDTWIPSRSSAVALLGCALMVVSFWFDGHTVSKGWRPLHAVTNSIHVVAGSVWVGGVVAMAAVVWARRRRAVPARAAELVVRFSFVAAISLAAVVAAGLIMAVSILDSFGDITGSEWGRVLLLKSAAVGLAALCGAYNHFRLLPAMNADPDDPALSDELRSIITAEAILLGFVMIVTAVLVAAAT